MTPFNVRDRPGLSDAQLLAASRLDVLPDALRSVRGTSNVVIIACLTNFLTSSEEASSISGRISPVMSEFRQHLDAFCSSRQSTQVMVAPPMYRVRPHWYSVGLPEILIEFSSVISAHRPPTWKEIELSQRRFDLDLSRSRLRSQFIEFVENGMALFDYCVSKNCFCRLSHSQPMVISGSKAQLVKPLKNYSKDENDQN